MRFQILDKARRGVLTGRKSISKRLVCEAIDKVGPGWWDKLQNWKLEPYWKDILALSDFLKVPIEEIRRDEQPKEPDGPSPKQPGHIRRFPGSRRKAGGR